ncbi:MAG: hypothetical protein K2X27_14265 [Candidatus Obscuribacterales bacterium]|nr:hypothetical protein [Candidatus Obscuribacterales bacterium]
MAGFSIVSLCFCPILFSQTVPESLFSTQQQEEFFFGLFGFISASWLLCWVASLNYWTQTAKLGQWLGLIFLCLDQVNLLAIWRALSETGSLLNGLWIAPTIIQVYMIGSFFGFFTLPGLTRDGNRTLTGLGTLALLLPWLVARDVIIAGTQYLHGFFY